MRTRQQKYRELGADIALVYLLVFAVRYTSGIYVVYFAFALYDSVVVFLYAFKSSNYDTSLHAVVYVSARQYYLFINLALSLYYLTYPRGDSVTPTS